MSALIKSLIEKRANVWEQTKTLNDAVIAAGGEYTAEQDATYNKLHDDHEALTTRIKQLEADEERNREANEIRSKYQDVVTPPAADKPKSDEDILRAMARGEARSHEFRDLLKTGSSSNTVPTSFFGQLQEHLIENSAIRQTNVTVLSTASGEDLQVPKTTTHPTAAIVAEAASITESDAVFAQVTLGAFKYGFSTQVSTELEQDTGVDLMGYLARIGGEALGNGSGAHFVTGTGSSQPNGVVTASTLGVTGATAVVGAFTSDNLLDLFYSVIPPYRSRGFWMLSDAGMKAARKLKDADGQYIWVPGLIAGESSTLLGRPVVNDTNIADPAVAAKSVLFGDLSRYFIRDVAGVRVERSTDFAFQNDLTTWRFLFRTDGDLIDTTGAVKHFIGGAS